MKLKEGAAVYEITPLKSGREKQLLKKKKKRNDDKWDYLYLVDLLEPLFYVLRLAVRGLAKIIN
ncbi:hypothetical protein BV582_09990 [Bacillus paralicheniformis]|nr:hypothetical protein BV582_09990 [Bacillus paralicheniformis]